MIARRILLILLLLASCRHFYAQASNADRKSVRVSILGVLKPERARITLLKGIAALKTDTTEGIEMLPLRTRKPFTVTMKANRLSLEMEDGENKVRAVSTACNSDDCIFRIEIPGALDREYRGSLTLTPEDRTISIVLETWLEDLVESITMSEMRGIEQPEALKAFAIVARTFASAGRRHPEIDADLCDTTHCQVYQAMRASTPVGEAVRSTENIALVYLKKKFHPFYSRNCSGRTLSYREVWGEQSGAYPFESASCPCSNRPFVWRTVFHSSDLERATGLNSPVFTQTENRIVVTGLSGKDLVLSAEQLRILLGRNFGWDRIPSNRFTITATGKDTWSIAGRGIGHGVGLCQSGSAILAGEGASFLEILRHYFPNTEIHNL